MQKEDLVHSSLSNLLPESTTNLTLSRHRIKLESSTNTPTFGENLEFSGHSSMLRHRCTSRAAFPAHPSPTCGREGVARWGFASPYWSGRDPVRGLAQTPSDTIDPPVPGASALRGGPRFRLRSGKHSEGACPEWGPRDWVRPPVWICLESPRDLYGGWCFCHAGCLLGVDVYFRNGVDVSFDQLDVRVTFDLRVGVCESVRMTFTCYIAIWNRGYNILNSFWKKCVFILFELLVYQIVFNL